jgi:kinetochore protein Mis13/DSN1
MTNPALPHKEVEVSEFYKHIESDGLSEPRRMKQLLTWCAERAMGEKPQYASGPDSNAQLAGKTPQFSCCPKLTRHCSTGNTRGTS